jgi:hypothetical protein
MSVRAGLALVVGLASGCVVTTGHLAAMTTRTADPALMDRAPASHVVGRSCINVVIAFPTGLPNIEDAMNEAIERAGAHLLTDVTVRYDLVYFPLVYGVACYVVEGDAR